MFSPRGEAVWPGIKRMKIGMRLKDHIDLSRHPPACGLGMRKDCCWGGVLRLLVAVLRSAIQRMKKAYAHQEQQRRCSFVRQCLNLADRKQLRHKESVKTLSTA